MRIVARDYVRSLVGKDIATATYGKANRVLSIEGDFVLVATTKSPRGARVPLAEIQDALDRLASGEEVRISVPSLGYRSAFVGAVMASLQGAQILRRPTRVRLD